MKDSGQGKGNPSSGNRKGDPARAERLRAALRENLKRRKSQARGRSQPDADAAGDAPHDSARFVPEFAPGKPKG